MRHSRSMAARPFVTLLALGALSACGDAGAQNPATSADALMSRFADTWNGDDAAGLHAMLADDVVMLQGDGTQHRGPDEVVEKWARGNMAVSADLAASSLASSVAGGVAYHSGRWSLAITPPGVATFTSTGSHTFIWERQSDGVWKLRVIHITDDPQAQTNGGAE